MELRKLMGNTQYRDISLILQNERFHCLLLGMRRDVPGVTGK
jgi:hypothetical protein